MAPGERSSNDEGDDDERRHGSPRPVQVHGLGRHRLVWTIRAASRGPCRSSRPRQPPSTTLLFAQISDSHIGFNKDANTTSPATVKAGIDRINALPKAPAFMLHTGDITHLRSPSEFDLADQLIGESPAAVFYVPGEHDMLIDNGAAYLERYGKGTHGAGWHSFDHSGVHFIGLVNVVDLKPGGLGRLGDEQLEWLENDLAGRSAEHADRRLRPRPAVDGLPRVGLGHRGRRAALALPQALRLGHGPQRAHPPGDAEGRRQRHLPHRHVRRRSRSLGPARRPRPGR